MTATRSTLLPALLTAAVLTAALPAPASAQSLFVDHGTSAYGAEIGVATTDGATGLSLGVGYAHRGFLDVGLVLSHFWSDAWDVYGIHATENGVMPYVNLHVLHQDDYFPASVAVCANFEKRFFSVDAPGWLHASMSGWAAFLGAFAYRRFAVTDVVGVTPQLTLGLEHQSTSGGVANSDTSLLLRVDGNLTLKGAAGRLWILNPFVSFDDRNTFLGLLVGGVFQ